MHTTKQRDIFIVTDFVNEMCILTDEFAKAIEERSQRVSDDEYSIIQVVVDKIDALIEKMKTSVSKAEGFIEQGLIGVADTIVADITAQSENIVIMIDSLEETSPAKIIIN